MRDAARPGITAPVAQSMPRRNKPSRLPAQGHWKGTISCSTCLVVLGSAQAQPAPDTGKGFYKYKIGSVEVTALYDGIWKKPHDPAFIKNASIEETKEALAKAGMTTDYV